MARLQVTTKTAEQVWQSPDGKITIFKLGLEYEGKPFAAKTYSKAIATPGWSGEVESYEKEGRNGSEAFVKQPQKEGGWSGGGGGGRSNVKSDPHTMYMSYAKDLVIACVKDGKFSDSLFQDMLAAVEAGGAQLYATRPEAQTKEADNVKQVFAKSEPVDEPSVTDEEIENTGLPL